MGRFVPQARQKLGKLIVGRINFTPDAAEPRYRFAIPGTLALFFNELVHPQTVASPMPGSWNHIVAWLKQIDAVRQAA